LIYKKEDKFFRRIRSWIGDNEGITRDQQKKEGENKHKMVELMSGKINKMVRISNSI